jgi:hypothetical protein
VTRVVVADLNSWFEDAFGTRDASLLLDDDAVTQRLDGSRAELEETLRRRNKELALRRAQLEDVLEDVADLTGEERSRTLAKARAIKERHERLEERVHESGVRLTAVLVVQALREIDDGMSEPSAALEAIRAACDDSPLPEAFVDEYLEVVAVALDLDALLSRIDPSRSIFSLSSDPVDQNIPFDRISIDESLESDADFDDSWSDIELS